MRTLRQNRARSYWFGATLALLLAAQGAMAADLTGHWRSTDNAYLLGDDDNAMFAIVQTGASVVMTAPGGEVYAGTISGSLVALVGNPPLPPSETYEMTLSVDESALEGIRHTFDCAPPFCDEFDLDVTMSRCECFDSNIVRGDGCDIECRVEPCHSCAGDPSTCTPVADATPCEHPSDCIAGGSCSAGVCEGGAASESCTDIGGSWLRTLYEFDDGFAVADRSEIVQDSGGLSFFRVPAGTLETTGTLELSTGALVIDEPDSWPVCFVPGVLDGEVASDGNSYRAAGFVTTSTPHGCVEYYPAGELGLRCASADLEPSDGCMVDSCQQCTGMPAVCVPVPDSTPCVSSDPCTVVATCDRGECVATISDECPPCTVCDGAGGCMAGPRNNCRATDDPKSTKLGIQHADPVERSSVRWQWKGGGAIRGYDFGRPDIRSEVALCVFDESTPSPALLYKASVNDGLSPWDGYPDVLAPDWKPDKNGGARFSDRYGSQDGLLSIQLKTGDVGGIKLKGKGAGLLESETGLPTPALPLPLRAQLQIVGGACFEGSYGADGVSRNADGVFRAKGTP